MRIGGNGDKPAVVLDRSLCDACGRCVEVCYAGALKIAGTVVTVGDLVAQVQKDIPFFRRSGGGVTLSGGEPARQAELLLSLPQGLSGRRHPHRAGDDRLCPWEVMSRLASVTDLFLYDIKFIDAESHRRFTGVPNRVILENLRKLAALGSEIHVRVPCIAGVNDQPGADRRDCALSWRRSACRRSSSCPTTARRAPSMNGWTVTLRCRTPLPRVTAI